MSNTKNIFFISAVDGMSRSKQIAMMGAYLALGIVLNFISNYFSAITFFGTITVMYVYCFLGGILFGAVKGGAISGIADLIQALIMGSIWWQLVLSNVLLSVITGLIVYGLRPIVRSFELRLTISSILCLLFCSAGLTAWAYTQYTGLKAARALVSGWGIELTPYLTCVVWRLATQWLWILLNDIILVVILRSLRKPLGQLGFDMSGALGG